MLGVANKDYDAAAIANSVMKRMIDRKVVDPTKIRSIYKSETFPTTGYGYAYNLDPKLVAKIKEAFFTFQWEGSALQKEFKKEGKFIPDHLQERLERDPQDRRGQRRQIRLQVTLDRSSGNRNCHLRVRVSLRLTRVLTSRRSGPGVAEILRYPSTARVYWKPCFCGA